MKKLLVLTLVITLALGLIGCTKKDEGGSPVNVDVTAIMDSIKDKIIADLRAMGYTDDDFEYEPIPGYLLEDVDADYLGSNLFEAGKTIRASMDLNADHIMVFKAKAGKANELKTQLESFKQERYEFWRDYIDTQGEKVNKAIIKVKGDLVYYIVYEDASAIESVILEAVK